MKESAQKAHRFFESKSGLIILGFLVTTVGGSLLNYQIQTVQSRNNQNFEMYKTRLSEAKVVEAKLLELSTNRYFVLTQELNKVKSPKLFSKADLNKFWDGPVTDSNLKWNQNLWHLRAQARTLFTPTLAAMLLNNDKRTVLHDDGVCDKVNPEIYEQTKPRSLHAAFVDAHATMYRILKKENDSAQCSTKELVALAEKQLDQVVTIQSCVAYRLSSELLRYPYGPNNDVELEMPDECKDVGTATKVKSFATK